MELLYRRVTNDFDRIPTTPSTASSEDGLGFSRSTYFYVERPHPLFGDTIVIFANDTDRGAGASVAPYDTGGLWQGHIETSPSQSDDGKRSMVDRDSLDSASYEGSMDLWLHSAIGGISNYRRGRRPSHVTPPEIDLSSCSDQAWTWEARVPKFVGLSAHVGPIRAYVMPGRRDFYLSWLRDTEWLTGEDRTAHLQWVRDYLREVDTPVDAVIDFLDSRD